MLKALTFDVNNGILTELIIKNVLLWVFILFVWVIEGEYMFIPINHLNCCLNRLFQGVLNSIFNPLCTIVGRLCVNIYWERVSNCHQAMIY